LKIESIDSIYFHNSLSLSIPSAVGIDTRSFPPTNGALTFLRVEFGDESGATDSAFCVDFGLNWKGAKGVGGRAEEEPPPPTAEAAATVVWANSLFPSGEALEGNAEKREGGVVEVAVAVAAAVAAAVVVVDGGEERAAPPAAFVQGVVPRRCSSMLLFIDDAIQNSEVLKEKG